MEIGVHHDNDRLIVGHILHDTANNRNLRMNTGFLAPVAGYHLISAVRLGSDQRRFQNAMLADTFNEPCHGIIHANLVGMIGEIINQVNGDLLHPCQLSIVPLCLGGEQTIYRCQQTFGAVLCQCRSPPAPNCGRLQQPFPWDRA